MCFVSVMHLASKASQKRRSQVNTLVAVPSTANTLKVGASIVTGTDAHAELQHPPRVPILPLLWSYAKGRDVLASMLEDSEPSDLDFRETTWLFFILPDMHAMVYTGSKAPNFVDPKVWRTAKEGGSWLAYCRFCPTSSGIDPYACKRHERNSIHQRALQTSDKYSTTDEPQPPPSSSSPEPTRPRRTFLGPVSSDSGSLPMPNVPIQTTSDYVSTRFLHTFCRRDNSRTELPDPSELSDPDGLFEATQGWESDWDRMGEDFRLMESREAIALGAFMEGVVDLLEYGPDNVDSDDEGEEWEPAGPEDSDGDDESSDIPNTTSMGAPRTRDQNTMYSPEWFPWPDRMTCTIDILMHLPRSVFSGRQLELFLWLLKINGIDGVPSVKSAKAHNERLQKLYGLQTFKYRGAYGHVYYVNSIGDIIAQEMSNPLVRPNLHFYPESTDNKISEARQGARWLTELPDEDLTPMVRVYRGEEVKDYYIFEPAMLRNGKICMPHRWFTRDGRMIGRCWEMRDNRGSWTVLQNEELEVEKEEFLRTFVDLQRGVRGYEYSDVTQIKDFYDPSSHSLRPWSLTDPTQGNKWRARAKGYKCLAFPIWLYCDDTSGNTSKKWNEHNSFLFTAAGLPRFEISKEYNVHFLCTSNSAPPLEMLDGIVDQLCDCQETGIWALDCQDDQPVLLLPSVLALLGDNPMQSEFACHIGLNGKFFCRGCKVKGKDAADGREEVRGGSDDSDSGDSDAGSDKTATSQAGSDTGSDGGYDADEDGGPSQVDILPLATNRPAKLSAPKKKKGKKRKTYEPPGVMFDRVNAFVHAGAPRSKDETMRVLHEHFEAAKTGASDTALRKMRTATGIKDTYQMYFVDKLLNSHGRRRGINKRRALDAAIETLPARTTSGVWRIKSLNPHTDTPVEILHVVLLGFVKYLWRDVIKNQLKDKLDKKQLLTARLSSVWVEGLGLDALLSDTLVHYYGSLTGGDFRKVVQVAPFVLHGLVSEECYATWVALSKLVPLIWQPEISDLEKYLSSVTLEIQNFLLHAAHWSIRWFNKPKFHILIHIPEHIRRMGPAMLFATETFESYNAVIREKSVHSNRQSPSRDIALAFAQGSRIRHMLSGGRFLVKVSAEDEESRQDLEDFTLPQSQRSTRVQRYFKKEMFSNNDWGVVGREAMGLVIQSQDTVAKYLGLSVSTRDKLKLRRYTCTFAPGCKRQTFYETETGRRFPRLDKFTLIAKASQRFRLATEMILGNGDKCSSDVTKVLTSNKTRFSPSTPYVIVSVPPPDSHLADCNHHLLSVARIEEILQFLGDVPEALATEAHCVLVEKMMVGTTPSAQGMPRLTSSNAYEVVKPTVCALSRTPQIDEELTYFQDILCTVNVQHDCHKNKCPVKNTQFRRLERHITNIRKGEVEHVGRMDDIVLNTAQMRDAKFLQEFRIPPVLLNREQVLRKSTEKEVESFRKKQKKSNAPKRTSPALPPTPPAPRPSEQPTPSQRPRHQSLNSENPSPQQMQSATLQISPSSLSAPPSQGSLHPPLSPFQPTSPNVPPSTYPAPDTPASFRPLSDSHYSEWGATHQQSQYRWCPTAPIQPPLSTMPTPSHTSSQSSPSFYGPSNSSHPPQWGVPLQATDGALSDSSLTHNTPVHGIHYQSHQPSGAHGQRAQAVFYQPRTPSNLRHSTTHPPPRG
ncbi:hypothetical protein PQX77_010812 [Marasmius sp. AFHP31]|nr:hypothetical protein PQX77_010812 [Marasmius sp. AFHP31]